MNYFVITRNRFDVGSVVVKCSNLQQVGIVSDYNWKLSFGLTYVSKCYNYMGKHNDFSCFKIFEKRKPFANLFNSLKYINVLPVEYVSSHPVFDYVDFFRSEIQCVVY